MCTRSHLPWTHRRTPLGPSRARFPRLVFALSAGNKVSECWDLVTLFTARVHSPDGRPQGSVEIAHAVDYCPFRLSRDEGW